MNEKSRQRYSFDVFTVDLARACLLCKGTEVKLRPKSFEAFKYLFENRGRLVTKEELMQAVWPDSFVTEDSLVKVLKDVRRALDDDAHQREALAGHGFVDDLPHGLDSGDIEVAAGRSNHLAQHRQQRPWIAFRSDDEMTGKRWRPH